jgi:hypothetical protein
MDLSLFCGWLDQNIQVFYPCGESVHHSVSAMEKSRQPDRFEKSIPASGIMLYYKDIPAVEIWA